jgi:hypothetical protein
MNTRLLFLLFVAACSANSPVNSEVYSLSPVQGDNVLPLTVNGGLCASRSYTNKPCVSVTVCSPGTNDCQTVNDILVDTGSTGLRVFASVLHVPLAPITSGSTRLTECIQFLGASSLWGTVQKADLVLGNEPAVTVPIQVADAGLAGAAQYCSEASSSPSQAGFNGILGVGLFAQDCGASCATRTRSHDYFACNDSSCGPVSVSLANQVQNPVALLPQDNNGVVVQLPDVPAAGGGSASGYLVLGIGTQTNNQPGSAVTLAADSTGEFTTTFEGQRYPSFIDSGSNLLLFPNAARITPCGGKQSNTVFYCPSSPVALNATQHAASGQTQRAVAFTVTSASALSSGGAGVSAGLAAAAQDYFDWGLPFFFGRSVFIGIQDKSSPLGVGPYWAF